MSVDKEPASGRGFIYILSNDSMPGLLKVGLTENTVQQRIRELSRNTGVPTEFKLERAFELDASWLFRVEQTVHRELTEAGFHHQKEFFKVSLTQCTTLTEDVIFRLVGQKSPEIVGLAERRLKAKEAQEKWESEEVARRESLVRAANSEIAQKREDWFNAQKKPSESKNEEPWYTAVGNFFALIIGIPLSLSMLYFFGVELFETVGFAIGVSLVGITGFWLYQRHKSDIEKREELARAEAAKRYPLKSVNDFAKRDYHEVKSDEEKQLRKEEERKAQSRMSAYRDAKLSSSPSASLVKGGKSWRLYRDEKKLLHIESNTCFGEGNFWRDPYASTGYWTNNSNYPFAWDKDIEEV